MSQHKEGDFVIPVLKTIYNCKEECSTEYIKRNVHYYIELSAEDKLPYPSRNKNEPRYFQVVGNLISHKNARLFNYLNVHQLKDGDNVKCNGFSINEEGKIYLQKLLSEEENNNVANQNELIIIEKTETTIACNTKTDECIQNESDDENTYDYTCVDPLDKRILEFALKYGCDKKLPANSTIINTVIELSEHKCEYATSIGKKHSFFKGKTNQPFMEGHHIIPRKASDDFFPLNLDRPSNIASLCPACHALLHHATREEKYVVLKVLYDNHIEQLKADGLYISFEKLLDKYY